jgi:hypothetical protein
MNRLGALVLAAWASPGLAAAEPTAELRVGLAGGGAPFLGELSGPVRTSSAQLTGLTTVGLRLPGISPRTLELSAVLPHGLGLTIKNRDLRLGRVSLHLLDVGVFYTVQEPVTVRRVERRWDVTAGLSAEVALSPRLYLTADARLFAPLDLYRVVVTYGDASRLIGEEILRGAQLWTGLACTW